MKTIWSGTTGSLLGSRSSESFRLSFREFIKSGGFPFAAPADGSDFQVVHGGALVGTAACDAEPDLAREVNVIWANRLVEAAARAGASRFLLISTSHVYADSNSPLAEGSELGPNSLYAETKLEAEILCAKSSADLGLDFTAVRVFSVIGATTNPHSLAGLLDRVVKGADELVRFASDVRDFQTPSQYNALLDSLLKVNQLPLAINLASGKGLSVGHVALALADAHGIPSDRIRLDWSLSSHPSVVADIRLLTELLGQAPPALDLSSF